MNKERSVKRGRAYHSPARAQQADGTRRDIALAARKLLLERGFDGTTIASIAKKAGVSAPTVYKVFGSKSGVLRELMDLARFGPSYRERVEQALAEKRPVQALKLAAGIARSIFDAERAELAVWRGAGVVSPELALAEHEREELRFTSQAPMIDRLVEAKQLRPELDRKAARELLWALTSRDLYRMLVVERGWAADRYEAWLGKTLVDQLTY